MAVLWSRTGLPALVMVLLLPVLPCESDPLAFQLKPLRYAKRAMSRSLMIHKRDPLRRLYLSSPPRPASWMIVSKSRGRDGICWRMQTEAQAHAGASEHGGKNAQLNRRAAIGVFTGAVLALGPPAPVFAEREKKKPSGVFVRVRARNCVEPHEEPCDGQKRPRNLLTEADRRGPRRREPQRSAGSLHSQIPAGHK